MGQYEPRKGKHLISALICILVIPITVVIFSQLLKGRNYYLLSLLIFLLCGIPLMLLYERRTPRLHELVCVAVMSGLATVSRILFFMVPQGKPVLAIVMLSGIFFGRMQGFVTGALVAFLSNFYYGQGPWTPFQMVGMALCGYIAGAFFCRKQLIDTRQRDETLTQKRKRRHIRTLLVMIMGGICSLVPYGLLVNGATILLSGVDLTVRYCATVYLAGIPFDLIHAVFTMGYLFLLYPPFSKKMERIRCKYEFMV